STVIINIDLFNRGKAVATGVKAVLAPNNCPYIINCSSTQRSYPAIGKYETETNTSAYQFTISSSYSGQPLNFILQVTNQYGKTWNLEFDLCNRPDPLAIQLTDTYFTSDINSIKVFWTPDSQAVGYNIYRCDADANGDEVGNYEKLNTFIFPAAFYNDEGLPELTKYYYKISAVSESGNESTPTQALPAWTSYSLMDAYPISMNITGTIRGSINVEDVFGDGNKEIFTSISQSDHTNGYLIGLKFDGTEWFNLDGNVTNKSGFAELGIDTWCTPAIGELEPNGGYKVLSMTRKVNFNSNKIFCHSALEDPLEPNPLNIANWEHIFSGDQCLRGPMIADVNNDGISECIFYGDYGGVNIRSSSGGLLYSFVRNDHRVTYSALAIADLNGNGNKEIIGCYYQGDTPGLYIWNYDGTNFGNQQPFYSLSGYKFKGSVVVCDLNNNGKKDILTIAINESTNKARVIALEINSNGTYTNIWNSTQTINISDPYPLAIEISVGDLNNDGNLEVVVVGDDGIYIWSNTGSLFNFVPLNFPDMSGRLALLADVDNDHEAEIIITYGKTIDAYKMDGTRVLGFPLQVEEDIEGYPCIADIDNDGQNEIIVGSGSKVYAWKTVGNPDIIEWGCQRANPLNTGEYTPVPCQDIIISENTIETWITDHYICGNITIEPNATLTILDNILHMRKNATITIRPSGKLVVNGGIITNSNDYEMWSGIIVEGTANTAQTYNTHACVDLKNGALI
ncbi:MAG: hypothetical protein GX879_05795, partial [Bacteroidales bacterium]|nr:hypothetical protein [Bacteroidales bacterium]